MYRPNPLKAKMRQGKPVVGPWLSTLSPDNAEVLSTCGFDFLIMDQEHSAGTVPHAIDQMRAAKGTDTAMLIRVPWNDMVYLKKALDAGVEGVLIPMVEDAAAAKAAVGACRYPPQGFRGAAGQMRSTGYGSAADYYDTVNDNLLVMVQIESAGAVKRIPEIAATPGLDMVFIGPRDLSASIGKLNKFDDPEVKALVSEAEQRIKASGKWLGSVATGADDAKAKIARGYNLLIPASDVSILRAGAMELAKRIKT
ncbi:MAG TPA: aldolase/citrate lyase family protein [Candidatus Cybelea sp.]|nr:aldolase/citrate lyase family protein [Candidatus Cybelea sp.]